MESLAQRAILWSNIFCKSCFVVVFMDLQRNDSVFREKAKEL